MTLTERERESTPEATNVLNRVYERTRSAHGPIAAINQLHEGLISLGATPVDVARVIIKKALTEYRAVGNDNQDCRTIRNACINIIAREASSIPPSITQVRRKRTRTGTRTQARLRR